MDLTTSSPHLLVFRDTRDQLMWLDQPCSGFDIVVVDSVVVLHAHCELVHDFSTEVGKVATVSKFQHHGPFKKAQWGQLYFIQQRISVKNVLSSKRTPIAHQATSKAAGQSQCREPETA